MTQQAPGWTPGGHPSSMRTPLAVPMAETNAEVATTIGTMATATQSAPSQHGARETGLLSVLGS